jgi:hypothetical protein
MSYQGVFRNKGNSVGEGTWTRPGSSGSLTFRRSSLFHSTEPTTETTIADGFGTSSPITKSARFRQELTKDPSSPADPNNTYFQGRQVYEAPHSAVPGVDGCKAAAPSSPYPAFDQVSGSVWHVGHSTSHPNKNTWGWDTVGFTDPVIAWYRANIPGSLPCTVKISQVMWVATNFGSSSTPYFANDLEIEVGANYVKVTRAHVTQTLNQ